MSFEASPATWLHWQVMHLFRGGGVIWVGSKTVPTPTTYDKLSTTILESLVSWRLGDGEGALTLKEDLECEAGLAGIFFRFSCVRTGLVT